MQNIPLVAIECTVYNHEPYLRDCLDGFVMQQTDFPFVAVVHDDASTDKSADIVREYAAKYPDIIRPIYETENQYSKGTLSRIMNEALDATGAKYIALCEGDDYWTDPHKLQKQVDFLESHPDYALTSHRYTIYDHERATFEPDYLHEAFRGKEMTEGITFSKSNYLDYPYMQTMSVVYRADCYDSEYYLSLPNRGDLVVFYVVLRNGLGYCMNFNGAVYRRSNSGVYAKKSWEEKHYVGFNLYSKMYYHTGDTVFLPHAISHAELVFGDIKSSLLKDNVYEKKKAEAVFSFWKTINERKKLFLSRLKLYRWRCRKRLANK